MFTLQGKVAVVTGSRTGLGRGMAVALAQAGCDVVGISKGASDETGALVAACGRRFADLPADVGRADATALIGKATAAFGHIDILVNNAGIIRRADALEFSESDWDAVMDVDLKSVFFLCQAAARQFLAQRTAGRIINIASLLSFQGGIRVPAYTAAKHGVAGLTKLLANEWAKHGITVNAIAPGYMDTDNTEALRADPQRAAEILGRIPMGRWGLPSDLGGPVVFLASDEAAYVTGHTLAVDGGWLAR
jgi:2-deoxy-D-gluconate 3-dehydrogenase